MKKAFFLLLFLTSFSAYSQKFMDGSEIKEAPNYCDVVIQAGVTVDNLYIDYGQDGKRSAFIVQGENSKKKTFRTFYQVISFMDQHGWEYFKEYTEKAGSMKVAHYLFRKRDK